MNYRILHGDCLEQMRTLDDNSVDAVVTDPPAGIAFMGKDWDNPDTFPIRDRGPLAGTPEHGAHAHGRGFANGMTYGKSKRERDTFVAFITDVMSEALRVLKPGGHALVWALPRTSHWTALALEDAGFEVRDCVYHLFGSGFPKSLDVSKAIDKAAGVEREVLGQRDTFTGMNKDTNWKCSSPRIMDITAPATPDAERWQGWGTALKPAAECWWLCRKPLSERTVAAQVLATGTGALNIDASRIGTTEELGRKNIAGPYTSGRTWNTSITPAQDSTGKVSGRWPANVILSHHPDCEPIGTRRVKGDARPPQHGTRDGGFYDVGTASSNKPCGPLYGDTTVEAWRCVDGCPVALLDAQSGTLTSGEVKPQQQSMSNDVFGAWQQNSVNHFPSSSGGASRFFYVAKASRRERRGSSHPTVKPVTLMRYLVRLITPPGGVVLDPFAGSGTTGEACVLEGFDCILIEREAEYVADIRARFAAVQPPLVQVAD